MQEDGYKIIILTAEFPSLQSAEHANLSTFEKNQQITITGLCVYLSSTVVPL